MSITFQELLIRSEKFEVIADSYTTPLIPKLKPGPNSVQKYRARRYVLEENFFVDKLIRGKRIQTDSMKFPLPVHSVIKKINLCIFYTPLMYFLFLSYDLLLVQDNQSHDTRAFSPNHEYLYLEHLLTQGPIS